VPCKDELPTINALWERFKDKTFVVVAIAEDSRKAVKPFIKKYQMEFPVLIDQYGGVMRDYGVRMLPASFIVNKKGKIIGEAVGPRNWNSSEVINLIEGLLAE
jgi:peroxiredoxin